MSDISTAISHDHSTETHRAPRRQSGEGRHARNARCMAEVAQRLAAIMEFGELEDCEIYTISQVSEHLGVSLRTLRFYEQSGLLHPTREGTKRLYSRQDIDQLKVIVTLRELEASLTAIRSLMSTLGGYTDPQTAISAIEGLMVAITSGNHERIAELNRLNRRTDEAIARLHTPR